MFGSIPSGFATLNSLILGSCGFSKPEPEILFEEVDPPPRQYYDYSYFPQVKFQTLFSPESPIEELYDKLKESGISDAQIDQGCKAGSSEGRGDGGINSCEVQNYILAHNEEFPDEAMKISDGPVPWTLGEDGNLSLQQEMLIEKIDTDIAFIEDFLGIKTGYYQSPETQLKLAQAIYLYAFFPNKTDGTKISEEEQFSLIEEFEDLGMKAVYYYLLTEGGLGLAYLEPGKGKLSMEALATESLSSRKGSDLSLSHVLHALFRRTGLKAKLGHTPLSTVQPEPGWVSHEGNGSRDVIQRSRYLVQVEAGDQTLVFNPVREEPPIEPKDFESSSFFSRLRTSLGMQLASLMVYTRNYDGIIKASDRLEKLGGSGGYVHDARGHAQYQLGEKKAAEISLKKCLEESPDRWSCHSFLGNIYHDQGKFELAVYHFGHALKEVEPEQLLDDIPDMKRAVRRTLKKNPGHKIAQALKKVIPILKKMKKADKAGRDYTPAFEGEPTPQEIITEAFRSIPKTPVE